MKKAPPTKSYALRIDGPLVKPLQELKKRNRRSLNAEINAALEAWITPSRGRSTNAEPVASLPVDAPQDAPAPKPKRSKKQVKQVQPQVEVTPVSENSLATADVPAESADAPTSEPTAS